jgi:hypothetical protein
VLEHAGLKLP